MTLTGYNLGYFLQAFLCNLPTSLARAKMTTNHFVLVRFGRKGQGFFCFGAQRQPMFLYSPSYVTWVNADRTTIVT